MGDLSPDLEYQLPLWRLVMEGQSLSEVKEWDLPTIVAVNDLLSMKADNEAAAGEAMRPQTEGGA